MGDETEALAETLAFAAHVIAMSEEPGRIRAAYKAGATLVERLRERSTFERVAACLAQFDALRDARDEACAGWMLAAVETRLAGGGLRGTDEMREVLDTAVRYLHAGAPTSLH